MTEAAFFAGGTEVVVVREPARVPAPGPGSLSPISLRAGRRLTDTDVVGGNESITMSEIADEAVSDGDELVVTLLPETLLPETPLPDTLLPDTLLPDSETDGPEPTDVGSRETVVSVESVPAELDTLDTVDPDVSLDTVESVDKLDAVESVDNDESTVDSLDCDTPLDSVVDADVSTVLGSLADDSGASLVPAAADAPPCPGPSSKLTTTSNTSAHAIAAAKGSGPSPAARA